MTHPAKAPYEDSATFRADLDAVAAALREARTSPRFDPRVMREAVHTCAMHARMNDCPPEKLVRALKVLVREVALDDETDAYRVLYTDRVIAWAIESFYEFSER